MSAGRDVGRGGKVGAVELLDELLAVGNWKGG